MLTPSPWWVITSCFPAREASGKTVTPPGGEERDGRWDVVPASTSPLGRCEFLRLSTASGGR